MLSKTNQIAILLICGIFILFTACQQTPEVVYTTADLDTEISNFGLYDQYVP